jgi:hypothetical protein
MPLRTFVVTMKAMHGCKRMRHGRTNTHRYDGKACSGVDASEMHGIAFQGGKV